MNTQVYPTFLKSGESRIFVVLNGNINKHAILVVPALFEEHNYSLSVVNNTLAKSCEFFARFDFFGCADSEGELSAASTDIWLQNIVDVGVSLVEQGVESITLLGLRFGATLMLANQEHLHAKLPITQQIAWKPLLSGRAQINQLSRLKSASFLSNNEEKDDWRTRISRGEVVYVGGYPISNNLLNSIENISLDEHLRPLSPLHWLELGCDRLPVSLQQLVDRWDGVNATPVQSKRFWQVPEIYQESLLEQMHKELLNLAV